MTESYRPYLLEIQGELAVTDFHVGSGARLSISTDAPVLLDAADHPYLPASSLRGVLRAHLEREAQLLSAAPDLCASLFGVTPGKNENGQSQAGRLRIFDAAMPVSADPYMEVRDHVKIDLKYGAAQNRAKFDQQVAAASTLSFRLVYEGDAADDGELQLVREAIRALEAGELSCGAKSGLGYGRLKLHATRYAAFDRREPELLAKWLNCRLGESPIVFADDYAWPPAQSIQAGAVATFDRKPHCCLDIYLTLHCKGPVLVRAPIPPMNRGQSPLDARRRENDVEMGLRAADAAFVRTGRGGTPYLPAASLRGVLRHQAERIAKTISGVPPVAGLFGEVEAASARRGLIEVSSGQLVGDAKPVYLDHVAIDRITGFAADGRKFATCGLQSPSFKTCIRLRFRREDLALVALVGFVLRDLLDGMLWCGGATSRGYGYIKSATLTRTLLDWTPAQDVPAEFLPHVDRDLSRPGRTRVAVDGPIPFDSWFWREAEQAWTLACTPPVPAPVPGGQSK